jgi:hypothetical protein
MKRIAQKLAIRAATRDIRIGVATGILLTSLRLLSVVSVTSASPAPSMSISLVLGGECLLYGICTVGVYRRNEAAAFSLAALFALRFVFLWYLSSRAIPPVSILILLLAYGLYRGIRGTSELEAMPARPSTPLANER